MGHEQLKIESQLWLKILLVTFVVFLFGLSGWIVVSAFVLQPGSSWLGNVISLALFIGIVWFASFGVRLIRFMNYTMVASQSGVMIESGRGNSFYSWAEIDIRVRSGLQMIEVWVGHRELAFAADWKARGASSFLEHLQQRSGSADV